MGRKPHVWSPGEVARLRSLVESGWSIRRIVAERRLRIRVPKFDHVRGRWTEVWIVPSRRACAMRLGDEPPGVTTDD